MNAQAELEGKDFAEIAAALRRAGAGPRPAVEDAAGGFLVNDLFGADFWRLTWQHLLLVFASLAAAIAIGIPLGSGLRARRMRRSRCSRRSGRFRRFRRSRCSRF